MIQGIWMWPNNVYKFGARKIIACLKSAGFTDIYFLTKGLSGRTSFIGKNAPAAFERDILKEVLNAAHQLNIRVHAWFTSASDEYYKSIHPESGRAHFTRGKDRELISFKDQAYRDYLKNIVNEVIDNYSVDGIHLDYIRYNHMLYGWDKEDILSYESFGADRHELFRYMERTFFSDNKDEAIFDDYKNKNQTLAAFVESRKTDVIRFAEHILSGIREKKPDLIVSAAVMPEGAYKDHSFADLHYGQIYDELSPMFDYLAVMSYSKAYGKTSEWISEIGVNLREKNISFITGIQAYDYQDGASIQDDINSAYQSSPRGIVLFREGECALAFYDTCARLFNDTPYPITKIELQYGNEIKTLRASIAPGDLTTLPSNSSPDRIRLYSNDKDVCIFYDRKNF